MIGNLYLYVAPQPTDPRQPVHPARTGMDQYDRDPKPDNHAALREGFVDAIADALAMDARLLTPISTARAQQFLMQPHLVPSRDVADWEEVLRPCDSVASSGTPPHQVDAFPNVNEVVELVRRHKDIKKASVTRCVYLNLGRMAARRADGLQCPQDVTSLFETLQAQLYATFQAGIAHKHRHDFSDVTDPDRRRELIDARAVQTTRELCERIAVGVVFEFGDQLLLYNNGLSGSVRSTGEEAATLCVNRDPLHFAGYIPTPRKIMENWLSASDLDVHAVADSLGLRGAQAPGAATADAVKFKDFAEFLDHGVVKSFAALSTPDAAPYLRVTPGMNVKLLRSFERDADAAYQEGALPELMQFTLNELLACMREALGQQGDFLSLTHCLEVIHSLIGNVRLMTAPPVAAPAALHDSQVSSFFTNCGMACLEAVLHACKMSRPGDGLDVGMDHPLVVAIHKQAYFESKWLLGHDRRRNFVVEIDEYDPAWLAQTNKRLVGRKIDLFITKIHSSFDHTDPKRPQPPRYEKTNAGRHIDGLAEAGLFSTRPTVTLDRTIGFIDDADEKQLLDGQRQRIDGGALSVITWRSGQKFDMALQPELAGAFISVHNDHNVYRELNDAMARLTETTATSWVDRHGMAHFQATVPEELDGLRAAIMETARRFMDPQDSIGFPADMFMASPRSSPLRVYASADPHLPFVNILLSINDGQPESGDLGLLLARHLHRRAIRDPGSFPWMERESFTFIRGSALLGLDNNLRLSPGLEPDAILRNYRDYLVALNEVLRRGFGHFKGDEERQEAWMRAVLGEGDRLVDLHFQKESAADADVVAAWQEVESKMPKALTLDALFDPFSRAAGAAVA